MSPRSLLLLADAVLALHVLFAAFIVLGLGAIWAGAALGRRFVHSFPLRAAHLAAMAVVAAETVLSMACPLTSLEDALRRAAGTPGRYTSPFVAFWAERVFYWDLPHEFFLALYLALLAAIVVTWRLIPVHRRPRK